MNRITLPLDSPPQEGAAKVHELLSLIDAGEDFEVSLPRDAFIALLDYVKASEEYHRMFREAAKYEYKEWLADMRAADEKFQRARKNLGVK